jgi:hypothetical protein
VTTDIGLNIRYSTNYPIALKQSNLQSYTWPVTIKKPNVTIQFQSDISYTSVYQYFDISASGVTIDLNGKNVSYYSQDSSGLWKNTANNSLVPVITNNTGAHNFIPGTYSNVNLTLGNQTQVNNFVWPITLDISGQKVTFSADLSLNGFNDSQYFVIDNSNVTININRKTLHMGKNGLWTSRRGYSPDVSNINTDEVNFVDMSFTITQQTVNNYVWPVVLDTSGQVVKIGSDINFLDSSNHYFIMILFG